MVAQALKAEIEGLQKKAAELKAAGSEEDAAAAEKEADAKERALLKLAAELDDKVFVLTSLYKSIGCYLAP